MTLLCHLKKPFRSSPGMDSLTCTGTFNGGKVKAYRILFRSNMQLGEAMTILSQLKGSDLVRRMVDFLREPSERGITGSKRAYVVRRAA